MNVDGDSGRYGTSDASAERGFVSPLRLELEADPLRLFKLLLICIAVMFPFNVAAAWLISQGLFGRWPEAFLFDAERNLPTLFTFGLMLACHGQLVLVALREWSRDGRWKLHWAGLALVFLMMAFDEISQLHENLIRPLQKILNATGLLYHAWVIPGMIFVAAMTFAYLRFVLALPPSFRRLVILAAAVYVTGVLGVEMVGGAYYESIEHAKTMTYLGITMLEETLEMLGLAIFACALLGYLGREGISVTLSGSD